MKIRAEIKVGLIILISIALLYFGLNYLKGSDIFANSSYYYAIYDRVDGLGNDNAVMLNGYKVGRVSSLELLPEEGNKILVRLEILQEGLKVPLNSDAVIINSDLLGTKAVRLEFAEDSVMHSYGDTLHSSIEKEIQKVVEEKLAPIQEQIEKLVEETRQVINTVEVAIGTVNETVDKAGTAIGTIDRAVYDIDTAFVGTTDDLRKVSVRINAIAANIQDNSEKINEVFDNLATISDSLTRVQYASAISNASNALAQIDSLITKVNNGEGSLGLLLNDEELYRNLEQAALEIDKLTEDMRVNPKRYVHFSVFGKNEKPEDKPKKKQRKED